MGDDDCEAASPAWPADVSVHHAGHDVLIRTLPIEEAQPLFFAWAAAEGWNPGLNDPTLFSSLDPRGFHVLYLVSPSHPSSSAAPLLTPIALLSTLVIDDRCGFLGPYITCQTHRSLGFGSLLFSYGLARLDPSRRTVGLDSTIEQSPSYQRRGFGHTVAVEHRYSGLVQPSSPPPSLPPGAALFPALDPRVSPARLQKLFARCAASGLSTPAYVSSLLHLPGVQALACLDTDGEVAGLVVARRAGVGYRVAPLLARDGSVARALLCALQDTVGRGEGVKGEEQFLLHIDVPGERAEALQLMKDVGLRPIFQSVRMSTRQPPPVLSDWVWGSEPCP